MRIPSKPRYSYATYMAHEFIIENKISSFPVDPYYLADMMDVPLKTYSEIAEENGLTLSEVIEKFGSEDGVSIYTDGYYFIFYNDIRDEPKRVIFTLLHELGHIYLNHFTDFEQTSLKRNGLKASEYEVLEREVNCFARNVLAPAPIVTKLNYLDPHVLSDMFNISYSAAVTRIKCLGYDLTATTVKKFKRMENWFHDFLYKLTHSHYCSSCRVEFFSSKPKCCKICGNKEISKAFHLQGEIKKMIYKGYILDKNGKPKQCPRCENEELKDGIDNCKICNTTVVNRCAGTHQVDDSDFVYYQNSCGTVLDGNARYCPCGNTSSYYQQGLLVDWQEEKEEYDRELALQEKIPF